MARAAGPPQVRDDLRQMLVGRVETDPRSGSLRFNARNRWTYLGLARLDIADHLWAADLRPKVDGRLPLNVDIDNPASVSSDFDRMTVLAESVMKEIWPKVSTDIDNLVQNGPNATEIKGRLADHAWCTLLVALVQLIEKMNKAIDFLSDTSKQFIKDALRQHFESGISRMITDAVITIVVDKVWSALVKLFEAHFPILGADTLRVLRMLAVFTCPSVEQHPDVYEHAVKPVMGDAHKVIADETKTQVVALFTEWWRRGPDPVV